MIAADHEQAEGQIFMTKRIICWLTVLLLLAGAVCAHGEEETAGQVYDHLTAASTTHMQGEFFTDMWGNATSDIDVRDLLHGYDLVAWDGSQGMFAPDPSVVSGIAATANDQGDTSFVLALQDDLYYSDGTKITAWDYAFSFLFQIAPEIAELGGQPQRKAYLLGYDDYVSGKAETLTGVRVPSDHTLMITISHEYLPFFYEMGLLSCRPYPIKAIAPGVRVVDDGTGVCLKNEDPTAEEQFTVQKLLETVCNPETGYRSHPSVVSGPYTLESWDGETAEFAINPYFKGDRNGKLPLIPKLTYTVCTNETMIDGLQSGQYDLLNKVMKADTIQTALAGMSAGGYQMSSYPRIGLSYISFCCEKEAVAGQAVRQAIAWCMDRDQFTADYTGNFGLRSDGYYGVGQWMYGVMNGSTAPPVEKPENENDKKAAEAYDEAMAAWEQLSMDGLTVYTADPGKAQ